MASTMAPEEYQELGQRYYKFKQYKEAVTAFTQGIEASDIPTLSLYDQRAASYDKLNDLNSAVKDGREMIKLEKKDVKGYLRTAGILEKMGKLDTALGIYKYGMKNVPTEDKNFKLLQQLHDKITRKLSPSKAVDPFAILPVELVEMIIGYLPFKNMVNCLRVSKGWNIYLCKRPNLWMHLDLSGATKTVSRKFVDNAVRRSQNRLTRATIHRFPHMDVLLNVVKLCKCLSELELLSIPVTLHATLIEIARFASGLETFKIRQNISLDAVSQFLRYCPTIKHADFTSIALEGASPDWQGPFPNLRTLRIRSTEKGKGHTLLNWPSLLKQTPALRDLTFNGRFHDHAPIDPLFSRLPLTCLILKRIDVPAFPLLPPTLKQFVLKPRMQLYCPDGNEQTASFAAVSWFNALDSHVSRLEHLSLSELNNLKPEFLVRLLDYGKGENGDPQRQQDTGQSPLRHLSLKSILIHERTRSLFKDADGLLCCSPRILTLSLQSLDISTLPCDDDEIEQLLTHPTSLNTIDLSSTQISGASIKMLVDGIPTLKFIKADNCMNITGRDAIHYAERRGISVSCSMSEPKGSRKVRHG